MINKFLKGGKKDVVMLFVEGLAKTLQADPKEVVQIAQQNPDALESAVKAYQKTLDMQQAAQAFTQVIQLKTLKAAHGAKLQYFKSLKHQCAEDEELVYYKSGGSLGCGCVKKKMEEGGQTPKKSPVDKFRNAWTKKDELKLDSLSSQKKLTPQGQKEKERLQNKFKKAPNRKDYEIDEGKKGMKVEKDCGGSAVIAKFKAKCGAKMKKHELGGSLNGIPFYLAGGQQIVRYDPMIHGISRTKSKQQLIDEWRARQRNSETNGQMLARKAGELVGNITAPVRVPVKAAYNWITSSRGTNNKNQEAINNRNRTSLDLGQRFFGLKNGGNLNK